MQSVEEIEEAYKTPDPWGFKTNPEDLFRRDKIIRACKYVRPEYDKALEIGAGEGFITERLPATLRYGFEVSKNARSRFPSDCYPLAFVPADVRFDLVVVPGVLYGHYDCQKFFEIIDTNANDVVVTCNIKPWENKNMGDWSWLQKNLHLKQLYEEEFPYREFVQKLRVLVKV